MNKLSRNTTWLVSGSVIGGVFIVLFLCCGSIGYVVQHQIAHHRELLKEQQKQQEVRRAERAAEQAERDEEKRKALVQSEEYKINSIRHQYEFYHDFRLDLEPEHAVARAAREDADSFDEEIALRKEYLPKLEGTKSLEEFYRLRAEQDQFVVEIRTRRYQPELESLRAKVAIELMKADPEAYYVAQIVPRLDPNYKFQVAITTALTFGFGQEFARKELAEKLDKPRIAIIRGKEPTIDYVVQTIFATNDFNGVSEKICPWRLVTTTKDKQSAIETAAQAASQWNEEVQDPREMVVLSLPDEG
jgi:hypothetical protein